MPLRYDAFISYRRQEPDRTFARDLLRSLESDGYGVAIDERDFLAHEPFLSEMERCIKESRFTLAVISPRFRQSGNCTEEELIQSVLDLGERRRRLVPLVIEKAELPTRIYLLSGIDFTATDPLVDPYERLKQTLGPPQWGSKHLRPIDGAQPMALPTATPNRESLLDRLAVLPGPLFEKLVFQLDRSGALPGKQAAQLDRAISLIQLMESRDEGVSKLAAAIDVLGVRQP